MAAQSKNLRGIDQKKIPRISKAKGPLPELKWIPVTSLRIDDAYQREILERGWRQIKWIAENFLWPCFSPVLVSAINDGLYVIIDGQHRTHAAYIAGYDKVPALCVNVPQIQQALAFSSVNSRVTKMTPHAIFKASLLAGEEWAVKSDAAVTKAGCKIMRSNASKTNKQPGEVFAISLIKDMVKNFEDEAVTAGLKALRESTTGDDVDCWTAPILKPWLKAIASNSAYLSIDLTAALDKKVDLFLFDEIATKQAKKNKEPKSPLLMQLICNALNEFRKENQKLRGIASPEEVKGE